MDDSEAIVASLEEFNQNEVDGISSPLNDYLASVASTGLTRVPWEKLKRLVACKLDAVIGEFQKMAPASDSTAGCNTDGVSFGEMRSRLVDSIGKFNSAPFTIQRLCELLVNPTKHYKTTEKFMRGIEKNLLVVSTVDPLGNKIVKEPPKETKDTSSDVSWAVPFAVDQRTGSSAALAASPVQTSPNTSKVFSSPWFAGGCPSVHDSPSLRGCVARRRPSPFTQTTEPHKRQKIDIRLGDIMDIPLVKLDQSTTPLLGHLLSEAESEGDSGGDSMITAGSEESDDDMKTESDDSKFVDSSDVKNTSAPDLPAAESDDSIQEETSLCKNSDGLEESGELGSDSMQSEEPEGLQDQLPLPAANEDLPAGCASSSDMLSANSSDSSVVEADTTEVAVSASESESNCDLGTSDLPEDRPMESSSEAAESSA